MGSEIRITAEDLFHRAADLAVRERVVYLDRACNGNADLRREVEELLRFDESSDAFLEKPALQDAARNLAQNLAQSESLAESLAESPADTFNEEDWTLGPYRIRHQIGKGGMGIVYLALDTRDNREVALKVLPNDSNADEDRLARFTREGRMLSELKSLKHPNIAEIYEQAEYDGKPCIALEFVPGDTLADRLRRGPLPIHNALQYALQIADALKSAHDRHIVHRDLKPANIKITPEGTIKVLDFGLAKRFYGEFQQGDEHNTRSMSLTESGMLLGTPAYMSPEQWNGQAVDQRTDIWAFGCLLYEMLTGNAPFAGRNRAETMKIVFAANPDWNALPKGTPLVVQDLLLRCFQREKSHRLLDAGVAQHTIAQAISGDKFALPLYVKTWVWKIDWRPKVRYFMAGLILVSSMLIYPPTRQLFFRPDQRLVIGNKDDLATLLPVMIRGLTPDLIRAALIPEKSSSEDLLQTEQWQTLRSSQENQQAIEKLIFALKSKIEEEGESAQLFAILGQSYLFRFYLTKNIQDKDDALRAVRKAQNLNADTLEVKIVQGNLLIALEKHRDAINVFEAIRKQYPDEPEALIGLAMAHDLSGDEEKQAETFYTSGIEARLRQEGKYHWGDFNDLGWHYFDRGEYERSADCWRQVVKLNPLGPTGYINLGNAFLYLGCFSEAEKAYKESITNGMETAEAHTNLGATYFYLGKYGDSINHLKRITSSAGASEETNLIEAWGNLGDSYLQSGQHDEAANAYNTAIKLADKNLMLFHDDYLFMAFKAEFAAKLNSLGQRLAEDTPINLIEKSLNPKNRCLECLAKAVTVYHFAKKDREASQIAKRAVDEGYSPYLLINNPELANLGKQPEFRQIQQLARISRGKC